MAINTTIRLPHHAQSHRVGEVLARLLGVPFEVMDHTGKKYAPEEMEYGGWHLNFEHGNIETQAAEDGKAIGYGYLTVYPPHGDEIKWMFHSENGDFEEGKSLSPYLSPLAIAVGQKLIRFFGGSLRYMDVKDAFNESVSQKKAAFPLPVKGQTGDDRWAQFYTALWKLQPLTPGDLLKAAPKAQYSREECLQLHGELMTYLGTLERNRHLETALDAATTTTPKPRL